MFAPIRALTAFGRGAPPSLLASAAAVTAMFSATPFLLPELADRFDVGRGDAGLISVVQVGAFALANLVLPRRLQPSVPVFRLALALFLVGNLASVVAPSFPILVSTRLITGGAAGALTWLGWASAMTTPQAMTAMSAVGPVSALLAAPALGLLIGAGDRIVFAALALAIVPAGALAPPALERRPSPGERSGSRSNRILLVALFLLTCAGAGLFVYEAVAAADLMGMSPFASSLGFSLNAAAGFLGARFARIHKRPGIWLATTGPAALVSVIGGNAFWFYAGMAWWGFAFWMGLPGVLEMLAARSLRRDERAGDAQALMAFGRSVGPGIGAPMVDAGSFTALAVFSGVGLTLSGLIVTGVQEGREHLPPTDVRTISP